MRTFSDEISYDTDDVTTFAPAPDAEATAPNPIVPADHGADAPIPLSDFGSTVEAGQGARDLIAREAEILSAAGLGTDGSELFYAEGTALAQIGHDNLASYDRDFRALPSLYQAARDMETMIRAEDRCDRLDDLACYRLDDRGDLRNQADPEVMPLQVSGDSTPWRQLTIDAKSANVNRGLSLAGKLPRRIRTRATALGDAREAFAIVGRDESRGYKVMDAPEVAHVLVRGLADMGIQARARVEYDRDSTRYSIRAICQAPIDIPALWGVGRVHQAFVEVGGADDGMSSIRGQIGAMRIRCLNASLAQIDGAKWSRNHKGVNMRADILSLIAGSVAAFGAMAESLQDAWSAAAANHFMDSESGLALSPQEAITRLVHAGHVPSNGLDAEDAIDAYLSAWRAEDSPASAAGVIMAIQRAAHETTWRTKWGSESAEEAASSLLYQPVYCLDAPEDMAS